MLDGVAFVKAQQEAGARLQGSRVLLIGAGGAGSAIAIAMLAAGVSHLSIHDSSPQRVTRLVELLSTVAPGRAAAGPPDPRGFTVLCNATPMGMTDGDPLPVDAQLLDASIFVGDVIAGRDETPLLRAARAKGCRTAN